MSGTGRTGPDKETAEAKASAVCVGGATSTRRKAMRSTIPFNPLAPRGARRFCCRHRAVRFLFQSTRPTRGETQLHGGRVPAPHISIHSPHAGRDLSVGFRRVPAPHISIHSPHAGRDPAVSSCGALSTIFQSTRPAEDETRCRHRPEQQAWYFNPLAPHGARQDGQLAILGIDVISIHSPRRGRDHMTI